MMKNPASDHDLLITLNVKVDNLATDIKAVGDGVGKQIADHEVRIRKIESDHEAVNPVQTFKDFKTLEQQVRDAKTTAGVYRIVAGFIGGAIFFILTQLPHVLRQWGLIK